MPLLHDIVRMGVAERKVSKLLKKKKANVNEQDETLSTPLHVACMEGFVEIIKVLLKKGADVNMQDRNGWTPFHCCASSGHLRACQVLLESSNPDVNIRSIEGTSVLHYLVRKSGMKEEVQTYRDVFELMITRGLNLNIQNMLGETPMHSACIRGNVDAILLLLQNHADANKTTQSGDSSVHYAVRSGNIEIVKLLLGFEGNPSLLSENGQTPIDVATEYRMDEIRVLLEDVRDNPARAGVLFAEVNRTINNVDASNDSGKNSLGRLGRHTRSRSMSDFSRTGITQGSGVRSSGSLASPTMSPIKVRASTDARSLSTPKIPLGSSSKGRPRRSGTFSKIMMTGSKEKRRSSLSDTHATVNASPARSRASTTSPTVLSTSSSQEHLDRVSVGADDSTSSPPQVRRGLRPLPECPEQFQPAMHQLYNSLHHSNATSGNRVEGTVRLLVRDKQSRLRALVQVADLKTPMRFGIEFPNMVVKFTDACDLGLPMLRWAVRREMATQPDPFASGSIYQQIVGNYFFARDGKTLLQRSIKMKLLQLVQQVTSNSISGGSTLEVDPKRCPNKSDLKSNLSKLKHEADTILQLILQSVQDTPITIRLMLRYALDKGNDIKINNEKQGFAVLGRILFQNFFCGVISSPMDYRLVTESPGPDAARALQHLSVIFRNLALGTEFDNDNHPYLKKMNGFLDSNRGSFLTYFVDLTKKEDLDRHRLERQESCAAIPTASELAQAESTESKNNTTLSTSSDGGQRRLQRSASIGGGGPNAISRGAVNAQFLVFFVKYLQGRIPPSVKEFLGLDDRKEGGVTFSTAPALPSISLLTTLDSSGSAPTTPHAVAAAAAVAAAREDIFVVRGRDRSCTAPNLQESLVRAGARGSTGSDSNNEGGGSPAMNNNPNDVASDDEQSVSDSDSEEKNANQLVVPGSGARSNSPRRMQQARSPRIRSTSTSIKPTTPQRARSPPPVGRRPTRSPPLKRKQKSPGTGRRRFGHSINSNSLINLDRSALDMSIVESDLSQGFDDEYSFRNDTSRMDEVDTQTSPAVVLSERPKDKDANGDFFLSGQVFEDTRDVWPSKPREMEEWPVQKPIGVIPLTPITTPPTPPHSLSPRQLSASLPPARPSSTPSTPRAPLEPTLAIGDVPSSSSSAPPSPCPTSTNALSRSSDDASILHPDSTSPSISPRITSFRLPGAVASMAAMLSKPKSPRRSPLSSPRSAPSSPKGIAMVSSGLASPITRSPATSPIFGATPSSSPASPATTSVTIPSSPPSSNGGTDDKDTNTASNTEGDNPECHINRNSDDNPPKTNNDTPSTNDEENKNDKNDNIDNSDRSSTDSNIEDKSDDVSPPPATDGPVHLFDTRAVLGGNGFVEVGSERVIYDPTDARIDVQDRHLDRNYFMDYMYNTDHNNYVGEDPEMGPVVISIETVPTKNGQSRVKAVIRTKQQEERLWISAPRSLTRRRSGSRLLNKVSVSAIKRGNDAWLKNLLNVRPEFTDVKLIKNDSPELGRALVDFEQSLIVKSYKFGVLYVKEGQLDENEFFQNTETSPQYDEFTDWLGEHVRLKGWSRYRGGLNVQNDATGTHSVYAEHRGMEIMFHVATMLPYNEADEQQLERKRHLGNDVVVVIFQESSRPFDPTLLRSHFNYVFALVSVDSEATEKAGGQTHYRFEFACREGVRPFHPFMPYPATFPKDAASRDFFLTKLINGERSAMYAPTFATKIKRTREALLTNVLSMCSVK